MFKRNAFPLALMGWTLAILLAAAAIPGVFARDFYEPWLGRRGLVPAQCLVQDLAALLLAPVLALAIARALRGSARALVAWGGILVFSLYYYSFYGMDKLYTPLYPAYLAIMGLGAWSLVALFASEIWKPSQGGPELGSPRAPAPSSSGAPSSSSRSGSRCSFRASGAKASPRPRRSSSSTFPSSSPPRSGQPSSSGR